MGRFLAHWHCLFKRYGFVGLMTIALNVQTIGFAYASQSFVIPKELTKKVKVYASAFEAVRDSINLSHFDTDELADKLDYDVEAAVNFVTQDIAFDPYLGVLRGPAGTLSTQAGSAWDQAVTLSALINNMGGEAMIVEGQLGSVDANRLLLRSFLPRADVSSTIDNEAILTLLEKNLPKDIVSATKTFQKEQTTDLSSVDPIVLTAQQSMSQALNKEGIAFEQRENTNAFLQEIANHYVWVQYRNNPNDPWTMAHPAFGASEPPTLTPTNFIADTVPKNQLHHIQVELMIERLENGKTIRESIMTPYRRPVANQAGQQITIGIGPNKTLSAKNNDTAFFVPMFNESLAPGAKAFNLMGLTVGAEDAMAGPEIFATVGNRFGNALDAISSEKESKSAIGIGGVILKVIHTDTNGNEKASERRLSDFRQSPTLSNNAKANAIVFDGVIDIAIGKENQARDYYGFFDAMAKRVMQLPILAAVSTGAATLENYLNQPGYEPISEHKWGDMSLFGNIFSPIKHASQVVTRQGPMVTMRRLQKTGDELGIAQTVIDIMHNSVIGLENKNNEALVSPFAAMSQGIKETVMEGVMIGKLAEESWVNAPITQVLKNDKELKAFINSSTIGQGMAERLQADFEDTGTLLIADVKDTLRWWKVNPQTGATLGMSYHGGAELTEEVEFITSIVGLLIAGGFAVWGAVSCNDSYPDNPKMLACCHAGNTLLFLAGVGAGAAVGAGMSTYMSNAANAALGYFVVMMSWEITADAIAGTGGGAAFDKYICKNLYDKG